MPPNKRCGPNGRTIRNYMVITLYPYTAQTHVSQRKLLLYGLNTRQHSVVPKGLQMGSVLPSDHITIILLYILNLSSDGNLRYQGQLWI